MKSSELRKVAQAYATCFLPRWQRIGSEFMRREGDWVQIVAFNASRFSEQYVPRSCMEFLKMPGLPTGAFLVQELQNPNATQRWIKTTDVPAIVFEQMAQQFRPSLHSPLCVDEIKRLLDATINYWPHAYALCVMACEEGKMSNAMRYFDSFLLSTADKPYQWVETRKLELQACLSQADSPDALKMRLEVLSAEKLSALKLKR